MRRVVVAVAAVTAVVDGVSLRVCVGVAAVDGGRGDGCGTLRWRSSGGRRWGCDGGESSGRGGGGVIGGRGGGVSGVAVGGGVGGGFQDGCIEASELPP